MVNALVSRLSGPGSSPGRDIVCFLRQVILLSQCLSPPRCINGYRRINAGGNPAMDQHPIQGGVQILSVASCQGNRDKLRPYGPLDLYADFTLPSRRYLVFVASWYKILLICQPFRFLRKLGLPYAVPMLSYIV